MMRDRRDQLGLYLRQVERLTGMQWLPVAVGDCYVGAGAYVWPADGGCGEIVYAGASNQVLVRLANELRWSRDGDHIGYEAFSRVVARFRAVPFYVPTATRPEALDIEVLIQAANVHVTGHPMLGCGLAWVPTSQRQIAAWDAALRWAMDEGGASGQEVA